MLKKIFSFFLSIFQKPLPTKTTKPPIYFNPTINPSNFGNIDYLSIMVTKLDGHWNDGKVAYYPKDYINSNSKIDPIKLREPVKTLFIKVNNNHDLEKAWEGSVSNLREKGNLIYFKVELKEEIKLSAIVELFRLDRFNPGWFIFELSHIEKNDLSPPFFEKILSTNNWKEFENQGYILLKLLGINEIYKFSMENQAGRPDGMFKIGNLVVIFDFTLNANFLESKEQQIANYVSLLQKSEIKVSEQIEIPVHSSNNRQVWIISKQRTQTLKNIGGIKVKEISVETLIDVYEKRLQEIEGEENLVRLLSEL